MRNWRPNLILIFIILFGATITGKLFFLQILHHDFYSALAQGQHIVFPEIKGDRGKIYLQDKDGNLYPLVINKTEKLCFVFLKEINDKDGVAKILSETLNLDKEDLLSKFKKENANFLILKENLTLQEIKNLEDLQSSIPGLHLADQKIREYPYQDFASHLIGFVNKDGVGQYGIEQYYDEILKGKEQFLEGERGPFGYLFFSNTEDLAGSDLILTVDYNIQFQAEKLLDKARENLNIEGGQIVVMDPVSGKILALAHFPKFNPNLYFKEELEIFNNGAIQKLFEPGSIFKPITMAGALNEGKITPQTTYRDPGIIEIGGWPIYNYDHRVYPGEITITEVLEKSINTGAVFAKSQLGHQKFLEYIENFKIFEKTGIDLPGEIFSSNEEFKKGYEINFTTASFGQGIAMNPLQLARAFCAIANGGKIVKPYLVEKIKKNGKIIETQPEVQKKEVISPETSSKLTAMLISVVKGAFARRAQIPGYYIAGKTGTAQMPWSTLGEDRVGYSDKTWQSFIGYAPAFDPKFLILIKLDNPQTKTAEYSAVPIFQELAKYIIDYYQIPPDYE